MQRLIVFLLLLFAIAPAALSQEIIESKTGVKFAAKDNDASLLGVGLRTKTMLKVKVYAIGLYVADSVLAGQLKGKATSPDLYRELAAGDFPKKVVMKFVRDVSSSQIRDAFHESLGNAGPKAQEWINYFGEIRSGQEIVIAWTPGTGLLTKVAGADKPVINDKAFASSVFGIWLGDKAVQDDLKKALVSRGPDLLN